MTPAIVCTADRRDLAEITGRWRWQEFFGKRGRSLDEVLAAERAGAAAPPPMPRVLVLLDSGTPVGMAALAARDLDQRPDLTPWLAGVYVVPEARRQGHAGRLVAAVEARAREAGFSTLWLYTRTAERIYARAEWITVESVRSHGKDYVLMRRDLPAAP
ncbi:GNAT family N-acetyltransferase [Methylobacterium sp. JK268]